MLYLTLTLSLILFLTLVLTLALTLVSSNFPVLKQDCQCTTRIIVIYNKPDVLKQFCNILSYACTNVVFLVFKKPDNAVSCKSRPACLSTSVVTVAVT